MNFIKYNDDMLLNSLEFLLMNNPIRRYFQKNIEFKRMKSLIPEIVGLNILEIGCGQGYGTQLINDYFKPQSLIATDLDPRMISLAKQKYSNNNIVFQVSDATNLGFKENYFDLIVFFGVIHHIPNWEDCLKELYRVLKPGGTLLAEEVSIESFQTPLTHLLKYFLHHPYSKMYHSEEFIQYLRTVGFKNLKVQYFKSAGLLPYFTFVAQK